jgi:Tfp pilus assembly protein PilO
VALLAADQLLLTPLVALWKGRAARIVELRKQVTQGQRLLDRESALRTRWAQMRSNTLPAQPSVAEQRLLKAVDTWAQESRLTIVSVAPQWRRENDEFATQLCRVEAAGNLATLGRFLYDLEKDPLALKLESVEISARDNEGQQLALGLQISGLVLAPQD